jgi:hypothetical protein
MTQLSKVITDLNIDFNGLENDEEADFELKAYAKFTYQMPFNLSELLSAIDGSSDDKENNDNTTTSEGNETSSDSGNQTANGGD